MSDDDRDAVSPGDGRTVHADPRQRTIVVDPDSPTLRIYKPLVRVDPTHEVFTLIGRTAAHMAQFEHVLDQIVKDLIRTKVADLPAPAIAVMTGQFPGAQSRLDVIMTFIQLYKLPEELKAQCNKIMNDVTGPQKRRNRIVHDAWFIGHRDEVARNRTMKKEETGPDKERLHGLWEVTRAEVEATITKIHALFEASLLLRRDVNAALNSSPGKPAP